MTNSTSARRPLRSRPVVWIVAVAIVVVLIAATLIGTNLYASSQNSAAPEEFGSDDTSIEEGAAGATGGDVSGEWAVGEGSEAGYRVDEVLNGEDVTVVGRTSEVTGSVTITDSAITAGTVAVDLTSVTTDNDRRDRYFTSQAIDTGQHPEATFTATGSPDVAALAESGTAQVELPGTLEINGQSQEATATVDAERTDSGLSVTGAIDVTWQDFGVEPPNLGFVSVEDAGVVEFSLALTQS